MADAEGESMAKHHPDLIMCRKQVDRHLLVTLLIQCINFMFTFLKLNHGSTVIIGRTARNCDLCEKCDVKCIICDSYVREVPDRG